MTSVATWLPDFARAPLGRLPRNVYRYVFATSALHQLALVVLTAGVALLEVVPLELQRRIVNDLVKHCPYSWVISLCAGYAGVVLVQGGTKLALNIYRGWVGERAKRELRRRVHTVVEGPVLASPAAEAQGITISMIVAEVEPIGGFVGESVSEPLLQTGIMASVSAYLTHIDPVDGAYRIRDLCPSADFCSATAGGSEPSHWSPHPGAASARYCDDRPHRRRRRRETDKSSFRSRHGDI
jgi:hypothetical protein